MREALSASGLVRYGSTVPAGGPAVFAVNWRDSASVTIGGFEPEDVTGQGTVRETDPLVAGSGDEVSDGSRQTVWSPFLPSG